eukprot:UN23898
MPFKIKMENKRRRIPSPNLRLNDDDDYVDEDYHPPGDLVYENRIRPRRRSSHHRNGFYKELDYETGLPPSVYSKYDSSTTNRITNASPYSFANLLPQSGSGSLQLHNDLNDNDHNNINNHNSNINNVKELLPDNRHDNNINNKLRQSHMQSSFELRDPVNGVKIDFDNDEKDHDSDGKDRTEINFLAKPASENENQSPNLINSKPPIIVHNHFSLPPRVCAQWMSMNSKENGIYSPNNMFSP